MIREQILLDSGYQEATAVRSRLPAFKYGDCLDAYPVALLGREPEESLVRLYARWAGFMGWNPEREQEPWLPVGRVGPLLMLAHFHGMTTEPGLPISCFQPVQLDESAYWEWKRSFLEVWTQLPSRLHEMEKACAPRRRLPETFILPAGHRAGMQFLIEYFPHEPGVLEQLSQVMLSHDMDRVPLPCGYRAAARRVGGRERVVDLTNLRQPVLSEYIPTGLELSCVPVYMHRQELWVAVDNLPSPAIEDALLNTLGEGWKVNLVLSAGSSRESGEHHQEACQGTGQRSRVSVEEPRPLPLASTQGGAIPGEIVIGERDVLELERYDPRRPDREPGRVFLRELSAAIKAGASDLHLEPGVERFRVRARVDGVMEEWLETGPDFGQALVGAAKEMTGLPAERFLPQDGSCVIRHGGDVIATRVSSFPIRKRRQKLVLRFLPRRGGVPALSAILPARAARVLARAAESPHGLILVCGPTGSGKTTTVFSALDSINRPDRNITTLEDPVEYELEGLNQAELDPHRGATWDVLLKGFLRQDPDAGLIGEIRDQETAETAVRQALTGHVVFATLHTMSCSRTLERLLDMGVKPDMLASALTLVLSQRLVRRLCPACRRSRRLLAQETHLFERQGLCSPERLFEANEAGCPRCRQGFSGRAAAVEFLPVTPEVAEMIEQGARASRFEEWMRARRFPGIFGSALELAAQGVTSLGEASEWRGVWDDFDWEESS